MAENLRDENPSVDIAGKQRKELIQECDRQAENCNYTAVALYTWQKSARFWKYVFLIAPIILGGLASSQFFRGGEDQWAQYVGSSLALISGFFPSIYVALNMNIQVDQIGRWASEYTNLRDRFRQAGNIKQYAGIDEFQTEFDTLMDRMDAARISSPPIPEWCFQTARKKIRNDHYRHDADE